jgi:hypothetical protein
VTAPASILALVERFSAPREAYLAGQYNETQLRREFLDPLFEVLGWDISNTQGNAEAYKDVVHEDAIKVGGFTKAPDYSFRIGGQRKFFLEAKKPSVNIKGDPGPAYQLRPELAAVAREVEKVAGRAASGGSAHHREESSQKMKAIDEHVDRIVYELCGLSQQDIDTVEAESSR